MFIYNYRITSSSDYCGPLLQNTILRDFDFRCEIRVAKGVDKEPKRIKGYAPALNVFHLSNDSQRRWAYYTWIFILLPE